MESNPVALPRRVWSVPLPKILQVSFVGISDAELPSPVSEAEEMIAGLRETHVKGANHI